MKSRINVVLITAILSVSGSGLVMAAADTQGGAPTNVVGAATPATAELTVGEVRKVDTEQRKLTIKHEALDNLGMPGMTMVFKVLDDKLLKDIKQGDKIMFRAEKLDGSFTVVKLEQAK
ncbi:MULTISPECIES: copper-binding protein [unclassified Polaromonas]|jgi:Cu/Ag efflux protein CusF|uniref:copper-binding protein n=1 Tax=unclassified Polaromonas TaxID=2638319 RepID=UPI000BD80A89|nr:MULTISPECIES: copper-binding protein [unclassified Polaromonas]OYY33286.1 MAG: hypothetical protein B7Y60_19690 [Polaromonas sp. 35-63-35]OYZ17561.1 MAG: hypothetical protein B7Y28_19070 [Polaromonas sp. 16-63-31]OYZ76679.1 MAG: hypothetical protein B7Y09_19685 [Polaromonas sp. 24-63-21]OZA47796.1 MAG: hypothetical protein B7X88_20635 [Polaromonas sp. 17-63-33]OZA85833.1 MAG: hypothetical protein B7X65_19630 [Polaromonas sp. 39-63-25]